MTASSPDNKKLINLIRGWPSPHLLPAEALRAAANQVLSDRDLFVPALLYGPDPGYQPLREELATWLAGAYGGATGSPDLDRDPNRICITGGASQALACILQSYTDPAYTRAVWAAAPCYHLACPTFEDAGFAGRLRAVREDEDGIDVEWLEARLEEEQGKDMAKAPVYKNLSRYRKAYRHIIYVVPTCANPSGKTMPLRRREELVRLARKYDALVIADDVYDFLRWPVNIISASSSSSPSPSPSLEPIALLPPPPRLSDIDRRLGPSAHDPPDSPLGAFGHAVSNGSFSKLVGPGVRTGWVEGTAAFAHGLGRTGCTGSGGAPSQLTAAVVCEALRAGEVDAHVAGRARPALRRRHGAAVGAVERFLGPFGVLGGSAGFGGFGFGFGGGGGGEGREYEEGVYGGYFLWLTLREGGPSAKEVAARAWAEENLIVAAGEMFEVHGDEDGARFPRNLRLCYSWEEEEDIVEGIRRLGLVLQRLEDGEGRGGDVSLDSLQNFK